MRNIEKRLRERITDLEVQITLKEHDLEVFRSHFSRRFKWWVELLGSGKTPDLKWLIEDDAKKLHALHSWWWK